MASTRKAMPNHHARFSAAIYSQFDIAIVQLAVVII